MNSSDGVYLGPLPDLFPLSSEHLDFCAGPIDTLLPNSAALFGPSKEAAACTDLNHCAPSPTEVHAAPHIFPVLNIGKTVGQGPVPLSSILKNNMFKTSLKSVLARPQSTVSQSSTNKLSKLSRKYPDRSCDSTLQRKLPNEKSNMTRANAQIHLRPQTQRPTRSCVYILQQKSVHSKRKGRSSSCSKLPRRKSQDIPGKRPGELADQAMANGTPLSKDEARAIRNRQHAMASRLRAKQKRQSLEKNNAELKKRIKNLEEEQMRLIRERDAFRL